MAKTDRSDALKALGQLARAIAKVGKGENETAAQRLLLAIARGLWGEWDSVRLADAGLREVDRLIGERQRRAIAACEWAIRAWRLAGFARRSGERAAAYTARLEEHQRARDLWAEALAHAIREQDPNFTKGADHVRRALDRIAARGNASPIALLHEVGGFKHVDRGTLTQAWKKRSLGS